MIAPLLELAARRASQADVALKNDETNLLEYAGRQLVSAGISTSQGVNLRVITDGKVGSAGTVGDDPEELLQRALDSAALGEPTVLSLPSRAALPAVATHVPRASAATVPELMALGHLVHDRLATDRTELTMTVERSLGSVRVANTCGLDASYDVSFVSLTATASRIRDGRRLAIEARLCGADLPSLTELEQLVAMLRQRLGWAERDAEIPAGRQRALLLPTALPALLLPLEQALVGKAGLQDASPLTDRKGARVFSERLSLVDDPLVDGRPGSRPMDDEGVPSRAVSLVRQGTVEGFIYDLETAGRVGVPPTGHGRRSTFAKPQPAYSNLVVEPGTSSWEELLQAVGDGLILERLWNPGRFNAVGGTFGVPATLAWRVVGGEIVGVVPEVTVAGNAYDLLNRVVAVGQNPVWVGSRSAPPIVVDGLSVF